MSILKRIERDRIKSRKNNEKFNTRVLTTLLSEVALIGKTNGNRETTDEEAIKVIKKFIKNCSTIIKIKGSRNAEFDEAKEEIKIYEQYVPSNLTEDELNIEIAIIIDSGIKNFGDIMKELNNKFPGRVNGKLASNFIKEVL